MSHSTVDATVATVAARQHGIITRRQLLAIEISSSAIDDRVRRGRLTRLHRGTFAVGHAPSSVESRWMAAVLATGDGSVASHRTAAMLHGILRGPTLVIPDVTTIRRHDRLRGICIRHSTTMTRADVTARRGIPVTNVSRTLLDLGDVITPYQLANVMHEAAFRRRLNMRALEAVIRRNRGRRAVTVLRRAIELHICGSVGSRSGLEDRYLTEIAALGVPTPLVNTGVPVPGGAIEVDLYWPELGLCIEIDGPGHARPRTRRQDEIRDTRLRRAGFDVRRFSTFDVPSNVQRLAMVVQQRCSARNT